MPGLWQCPRAAVTTTTRMALAAKVLLVPGLAAGVEQRLLAPRARPAAVRLVQAATEPRCCDELALG